MADPPLPSDASNLSASPECSPRTLDGLRSACPRMHKLFEQLALDVAFLTKTEKSKRPVKIPTRVRPLLAKLAVGKAPTEPLFPGALAGRKSRQWLWDEVRRLCQKADVPLVCPHSLRGWMATAAVAAGELPEVVAQALGHTSCQITLGHYIAPGVAEAAQLERGQAAFAAALPD